MRQLRVFDPNITVGDCLLNEKTSHYLKTVLRRKPGDQVHIFDGKGQCYQATIGSTQDRTISVSAVAIETDSLQSPLELHLGQALIKKDKFDWVLQKATELGVHHITPLMTRYSEVHIKPDSLENKMQHWQQILMSACEQCGRNTLPKLNTPCDISTWLSEVECEAKLIADPWQTSQNLPHHPQSIALAIGPEGGFDQQEQEAAQTAGFLSLKMGPRILRSETAAITGLSLLQQQFGDFGI